MRLADARPIHLLLGQRDVARRPITPTQLGTASLPPRPASPTAAAAPEELPVSVALNVESPAARQEGRAPQDTSEAAAEPNHIGSQAMQGARYRTQTSTQFAA